MAIDTDYLVDIPVEDIGVESDQLYKALLGDQCFCLTDICPPKIDFADWEIPGGLGEDALAEITPLSIDKLTNQEKTGVFDAISQSIKDLLQTEFDKGRITGAAYAETFVRLIEASLANSTQFLLQRDISYWQSRKGFYDAWAVKAQTELTKHNIALIQMQQLNQQTEFAAAKMRVMVDKEQYVTAVVQRDLVVPKQLEAQDSQIAVNTKQLDVLTAQIAGQEAQTALTTEQTATQAVQTSLSEYQLSYVLPAQVAGQEAQTAHTEAQTLMVNSQRTLSLPKQIQVQDSQIALYNQQVTSYQRDAELKAAKVFTDTWVALSTVNGADDIPAQYNLTNLNQILTILRAKNDLD